MGKKAPKPSTPTFDTTQKPIECNTPQHNLEYSYDDAITLRANLINYKDKFINSDPPTRAEAEEGISQLFYSMIHQDNLLLQYIGNVASSLLSFDGKTLSSFDTNTFNTKFRPFLRCLAISLKYDTIHDFTTARGTDSCKHKKETVIGIKMDPDPPFSTWMDSPLAANVSHFKDKLKIAVEKKYPTDNAAKTFIDSELILPNLLVDLNDPSVLRNAVAEIKKCSYIITDIGIKKDVLVLAKICNPYTCYRSIFSMIDSAGQQMGKEKITFFIKLRGQVFLYNIGLIFFQSFYVIMKDEQKRNNLSSYYLYISIPNNHIRSFDDFQKKDKPYNLHISHDSDGNIINDDTTCITTVGGDKNCFAVPSACKYLYISVDKSFLNVLYSENNTEKPYVHNAIFCIMKGYGDFGQLFLVQLMSSLHTIHRFFVDDDAVSKRFYNLNKYNFCYNPLYENCILETNDTYLMKIAYVCQTNFITATKYHKYYFIKKGPPTAITNIPTLLAKLADKNIKSKIPGMFPPDILTTLTSLNINTYGGTLHGPSYDSERLPYLVRVGGTFTTNFTTESVPELLGWVLNSSELYLPMETGESLHNSIRAILTSYDKGYVFGFLSDGYGVPVVPIEDPDFYLKPKIEVLTVLEDIYITIKEHTFQLYFIKLKSIDKVEVEGMKYVSFSFEIRRNGVEIDVRTKVINTYDKIFDFYDEIYSSYLDVADIDASISFMETMMNNNLLNILLLKDPNLQPTFPNPNDVQHLIDYLNFHKRYCKRLESILVFFDNFLKDTLLKTYLFSEQTQLCRAFSAELTKFLPILRENHINRFRLYLKDLLTYVKVQCDYLKERFHSTNHIEYLFTNIIDLLQLYIEEIDEYYNKILGFLNKCAPVVGGKKYKENSELQPSQKIYNNLQYGGDDSEFYNFVTSLSGKLNKRYEKIDIDEIDSEVIKAIPDQSRVKNMLAVVINTMVNIIDKMNKTKGEGSIMKTSALSLTKWQQKKHRGFDRRVSMTAGGGNYSKIDELKLDKSIKKYINILGKKRRIYTKIGSKKEYIKTKNHFVLIKDFIKLHSKSSIKPSKTIKDTKLPKPKSKPKVNKASQEDINISPKPKSKPNVNKVSQEAQKDINISPKPKSKPNVNKVSQEAQKDINISPKPKSKPKVNKASQEAQKDINISPKPKSKPKVNKASQEAQKDINISPKSKSKPKVNKVK